MDRSQKKLVRSFFERWRHLTDWEKVFVLSLLWDHQRIPLTPRQVRSLSWIHQRLWKEENHPPYYRIEEWLYPGWVPPDDPYDDPWNIPF